MAIFSWLAGGMAGGTFSATGAWFIPTRRLHIQGALIPHPVLFGGHGGAKCSN